MNSEQKKTCVSSSKSCYQNELQQHLEFEKLEKQTATSCDSNPGQMYQAGSASVHGAIAQPASPV